MTTTELRTWTMPDEPGAPIDGVRDRDGDLWRMCSERGWQNLGGAGDEWTRDVGEVGEQWYDVLRYAPLREVRRTADLIGPIEITEAMIAAATEMPGSRGSMAMRERIARALRAGGFEVAE